MKTPVWQQEALRQLSTTRYRWLFLALAGLVLVGMILGLYILARTPAGAGTGDLPTAPPHATGSADVTPLFQSSDASGWQSGARTAAATILVIGLFYASVWGYRYLTQRGRLARREAEVLRLRAAVRLNSNQSLHVVQFGSEVLLVGASPAGLVLLDKMPESALPKASPAFSQALDDALAGGQQ